MTIADMIKEHLKWMQAGGLADNTRASAAGVLRRADTALPNGLLADAAELATWLADPAWSNQTRASYRQHLVRFYTWGVESGWIDFDPTGGLRRPTVPPGVPRPATDSQVTAALRLPRPWSLHAVLAAYAGLRCCEIARLHRGDIDPDVIRVHGKGGRTRIVPTTRPVWRAVAGLPPGPVTVRRRDRGPATASWVSLRTAEHLRRHGIDATLHQLRHWYATRTLAACGNLRVVQELLGHASPATTAVYTQVSDRQKADAVRRLPDLDAAA